MYSWNVDLSSISLVTNENRIQFYIKPPYQDEACFFFLSKMSNWNLSCALLLCEFDHRRINCIVLKRIISEIFELKECEVNVCVRFLIQLNHAETKMSKIMCVISFLVVTFCNYNLASNVLFRELHIHQRTWNYI